MNAKGNGRLEDPSYWPPLRAPVQKSSREEFLKEETEELRAFPSFLPIKNQKSTIKNHKSSFFSLLFLIPPSQEKCDGHRPAATFRINLFHFPCHFPSISPCFPSG
jgi:hypothetical protein